MENQDTLKYMSNMLENINGSISVLAINQLKLIEKYDKLDEKVDKNHEEVIKEIKGLREDVDTIYDLEMDTRKTVKQNSKNILKILNNKKGYETNNRFIN